MNVPGAATRRAAGGLLAAGLLGLWVAGLQAKPCGCDDIAQIENVLDQTIRAEAAWDKVLYQMVSGAKGAPQNDEQARAQVNREVWPPGTPQPRKEGGLDSSGEPTITPGAEDRFCDIILESIKLHEQDHHDFYLHRYLWVSMTASSDRRRAMVHAASESDAHALQAKYLSTQLKKLKRKCHPAISDSSDPSQAKEARQAQQHKTARAANRVAMYANSIH